jgi:SAM-dependent methyltransferase
MIDERETGGESIGHVTGQERTSAEREDRQRLQREAEFHDRSYSTQERVARVGKFYAAVQRSRSYYINQVLKDVGGLDVLEYGCGINADGIEIAEAGARVTGIDISKVAVEQSAELAEQSGVSDRVDYRVMNAEELAFQDDSFDRVCGTGILHHLDLGRAYAEIRRVLRPGGAAVFYEPLGHNPLINRYRNKTPELRTPDEHPLLVDDIKNARKYFGDVRATFFHLTSIALVPLRNSALFKPLYALAEGLDRILMAAFPPLKSWGWMVVIEMKP